ncbi:hypothetical protein IMY05_C4682000100 [Salix suchowensis]|nr:hypothetical protein IMY05_C4682000100 [Salix suchowensis]
MNISKRSGYRTLSFTSDGGSRSCGRLPIPSIIPSTLRSSTPVVRTRSSYTRHSPASASSSCGSSADPSKTTADYYRSLYIRGDNTIAKAEAAGALIARKLYSDIPIQTTGEAKARYATSFVPEYGVPLEELRMSTNQNRTQIDDNPQITRLIIISNRALVYEPRITHPCPSSADSTAYTMMLICPSDQNPLSARIRKHVQNTLFLVGASGYTGGSIVRAILEAGNFVSTSFPPPWRTAQYFALKRLSILVREASINKPTIKELAKAGAEDGCAHYRRSTNLNQTVVAHDGEITIDEAWEVAEKVTDEEIESGRQQTYNWVKKAFADYYRSLFIRGIIPLRRQKRWLPGFQEALRRRTISRR